MIVRPARHLVALLPLLVGLSLLRLMAELAERRAPVTLTPLWQLDPLVLVSWVLLPLGAAWPERSLSQCLILSAAVIGAMLALAAPDPIVQLLIINATSFVLYRQLSLGWLIALAAMTAVILVPHIFALLHISAEQDRAFQLFGLTIASAIGTGAIPLTRNTEARALELVLRPFWLFALLRTLETGPWPLFLTLGVPLTGASIALSSAIAAMHARDDMITVERLSTSLCGMVLICTGLSSPAGVAAALWVIAIYALLLVLARAAGGRLTISASLLLIVACWWTFAAAAGGRAFLISAVALLTGCILIASVVLRSPWAGIKVPVAFLEGTAAILIVLLTLFMPVLTRDLAQPVVDQLGAGLTSFGLLQIWPWLGVATLDAAHTRVALMSGPILVPLIGILLALLWLLLRIIGQHRGALQMTPLLSSQSLRRLIHRRLWWAGSSRDG
jgi:hypothetical protein